MRFKILVNSITFKIIMVFLIFTIPLVVLLIINNNYAINVVRKQVAQSDKNLVSLYMEQIDQGLDEVDKYLYNLAALNGDLINLELSNTENSQIYYKAKIRLSNEISTDINRYKIVDTFFVYSSMNQDLLIIPNSNTDYKKQESDTKSIEQLFQREQISEYQIDQWHVYNTADGYSLFHTVKVGSVYIGAWVSVENLMIPLNLVDLGERGRAILATGDNVPIIDEAFVNENEINLDIGPDLYNLSGDANDFLIVGAKSNKGDFRLIAIIPNSVILENLPYIQKIVSSLIPVVFALFVLLIFLFLRKIMLQPMDKILKAMKRIKNGELNFQISPYKTSNEFALMNETFNSMVNQIHDLKIQVYEDRIEKQKFELKHMQLQIKPHFFLNSLNIIYQLAQVKNYVVIKEMSQSLIEYFRFMFRSSLSFVKLEDEIKHTDNYLRIQKMRFHEYLNYSITATDSLMEYIVPPLIMQTFVENAIKYAVTMDAPVAININVELVESSGNSEIKISIWDTGKGFSEEILDQLQSGIESVSIDMREQIGIWNAQQRLRLLYNNRARIQFANRSEGGACVIIYVPLRVETEKGDE